MPHTAVRKSFHVNRVALLPRAVKGKMNGLANNIRVKIYILEGCVSHFKIQNGEFNMADVKANKCS
jgi:hypothetical protein